MADTPTQRTIKIGKASIGLVGFDTAFNQIVNKKNITEDKAVTFLFDEVSKQNYVPANAVDLYKQALRKEYRRRIGKETTQEQELVIRVLGPGCVSCNQLTTMLIEALQKLDLAADMESVSDLDEIWRYGVLTTPALVINNEVICSGRMPTQSQVDQWVKEAAEK